MDGIRGAGAGGAGEDGRGLEEREEEDGGRGCERRHGGVPVAIQRLGQRAEGLPKATPLNLRKLAETPVPRKAINTIKDRIACMGWRVEVKGSGAREKGRGAAEQRGGKSSRCQSRCATAPA